MSDEIMAKVLNNPLIKRRLFIGKVFFIISIVMQLILVILAILVIMRWV